MFCLHGSGRAGARDLAAARHLAEDAVAATSGFHLSLALTRTAACGDVSNNPTRLGESYALDLKQSPVGRCAGDGSGNRVRNVWHRTISGGRPIL